MLVSEFLNQVRDVLDDQFGSQWSAGQLRRWVNAGLDDVSRSTHWKELSTDVAVSAGDQTKAIPADVVEIQHAYFLPTGSDEVIPLVAYHYERMDQIWGSWQNSINGDPQAFAPRGVSPNITVWMYPVPDRAGTLRVFYAGQATNIDVNGADDGNQLDMPQAWVDVLVHYVEYRALRKDRDPRWQEAFGLYQQARDELAQHDTLAVARQVVHDAATGGMPRWLVDPTFEIV